ncbi:phenylacetate--CoA ligase family protein [Sphaerisporangium fuscum]|uniref:phenylacetate--CoA ligase family protein n=1 Tax=Sphaerisporangium fuscum TaxID=2835868 RepID=UPI001BDC1D35|nr:AMP-binding protein [Sphaerisporangium fuscum]
MPEFLLSTPELTEAHLARVRGLLASLKSVPALAGRYEGIESIDSLDDLAKLPVLLKDDLQVALAHLSPRAGQGATWVFQSGGSTGRPQIGYAPTGLYMREVHDNWKALTPDDVFVNGWSAGKMWGAHFLVNAYVEHTGCVAMNLGAMNKDEYDPWLEFFATRKVTAFGGTPSVLRLVFGHARDAGIKLPDLRKVLWLGEGWDPQLTEDLAAVAPNARRWGMFGSTETWVVATNTPECAADTWHPLPTKLWSVGEDEMIDFTTLNPDGLNPILRYRTGDAGRVVSCPCGDPRRAVRILGRRDGLIKFRGHLLNVAEFVADVGARPGVARAQLVLKEPADGGSVLEVLLLPSGEAGPRLAAEVREHIVGSAFGPSIVFQRNPHSLEVTITDTLIGNTRTGKIPDLVRPDA